MQIQLVHPDPLVPLPVDPSHYVAALQNKPGELDALRHASPETWERLTPLVHFVGPKARGDPFKHATIRNWVARVASAVGSHPFYLDVMRLRPTHSVTTSHGDTPVLAHIYALARKRGLRFVPVYWIGEGAADHCRLVADAALQDGHGMAVRYRPRTVLPPPGTSLGQYLAGQLGTAGVEARDADLLVDLEYVGPDDELDADDLAASINEMLTTGEWRSVVVLATSMPSMLSSIKEGDVGSLPRREWDLWCRLRTSGLPRIPSFGDYAVQHPRPPQDGGGPGMRANIRYTANGETLIARGRGLVIQEGKEQYRALCQQLLARSEFSGGDYSWGDGVIARCASGRLPPGAQNMWRGAGTSHHLEFVTDQLRRLPVGS